MLFTQNYQNQSVLHRTTLCQSLLVFCDTLFYTFIDVIDNVLMLNIKANVMLKGHSVSL